MPDGVCCAAASHLDVEGFLSPAKADPEGLMPDRVHTSPCVSRAAAAAAVALKVTRSEISTAAS